MSSPKNTRAKKSRSCNRKSKQNNRIRNKNNNRVYKKKTYCYKKNVLEEDLRIETLKRRIKKKPVNLKMKNKEIGKRKI